MSKLGAALCASVAFAAFTAPAQAVPARIDLPSLTINVADGCGPGAWRGPWGHCRTTPYYGPLPNGYYQEPPSGTGPCPPGYWRGPWGHCRNTPYHGPLPGGGFQP